MDDKRFIGQISRTNVRGKTVALPIERFVAVVVVKSRFSDGNHFRILHSQDNLLFGEIGQCFVLRTDGKGGIETIVFSSQCEYRGDFGLFRGNDHGFCYLGRFHSFEHLSLVISKLRHVNVAMSIEKHGLINISRGLRGPFRC